MIYTVELFNSDNPGTRSPQWWKNFIRGNKPGERFNKESTNDRLLEYSASYVVMSGGSSAPVLRYVDFYDEQAYLWFVLRWL